MEFESKIEEILESFNENPDMTPDELDEKIDEVNEKYSAIENSKKKKAKDNSTHPPI